MCICVRVFLCKHTHTYRVYIWRSEDNMLFILFLHNMLLLFSPEDWTHLWGLEARPFNLWDISLFLKAIFLSRYTYSPPWSVTFFKCTCSQHAYYVYQDATKALTHCHPTVVNLRHSSIVIFECRCFHPPFYVISKTVCNKQLFEWWEVLD